MLKPSLLKGHPYTPSHATDIRKTFARIRKERREQERLREAAQQAQAPKAANVAPIKERKRA